MDKGLCPFFFNLFPPAMEMLTSRTMSLRVDEAVCWKDLWGQGVCGEEQPYWAKTMACHTFAVGEMDFVKWLMW